MNPSFTISAATLPEHYACALRLFKNYQRWLGIDLCFQHFNDELNEIPSMYGPPLGALLLAKMDNHYVGCVGLRLLEPGIAEMKRMYLAVPARGLGIGRALAERCVLVARDLGYTAIRLDTLPRLGVATAIYRKLGFIEIAPYRHNPDPETLFFELKL
jgi:putative acetyltransferase